MRGPLVALAVLYASATAQAAPAEPWATGVSAAEQKVALAIFRAGNEEFVEARYSQALVKYREALTHWDHPAIRYNMAVCLMEMHQPVEAFEHLEKALQYGDAPLDPVQYKQGIAYREKLSAELTRIDVTCASDGARVTVDGQPLLTCPGNARRVLIPGRHEIVARRDGFVPFTEDVDAVAGHDTSVTVTMKPLEDTSPTPPVTTVRTAAPTTKRVRSRAGLYVIGGGATLGLVALGYDLFGVRPIRERLQSSPEAYDAEVDAFRTHRNVDVALFATAGIAVAVGVVLHVTRGERTVVVAPSIGPDTAMLSLQWR